jgi:hypothetical protein
LESTIGDHVDGERFASIRDGFPAVNFVVNDGNVLCSFSGCDIEARIKPLETCVWQSRDGTAASFHDTFGGVLDVMFYCTRLYRFAEKGVTHCEVKGVTGEDGIGFTKGWNVGKEVILDMVLFAPFDKMV